MLYSKLWSDRTKFILAGKLAGGSAMTLLLLPLLSLVQLGRRIYLDFTVETQIGFKEYVLFLGAISSCPFNYIQSDKCP